MFLAKHRVIFRPAGLTMLRILLINDRPLALPDIRTALCPPAYQLLAELHSSTVFSPAEYPLDLILIDSLSPSPALLERLGSVRQSLPMLMFADIRDPQQISTLVGMGVFLADHFEAGKLAADLALTLAYFKKNQQYHNQIQLLEQQLADRKFIERAKGVLMDKRHLSEPEAYYLLRTQAMKQGSRLGDVARQIITVAELLT